MYTLENREELIKRAREDIADNRTEETEEGNPI
jgi:hypothetical protein